ncbi:MAG: hypothetical protein A3J28_09135 [Acidobacteria bacterium RIFCSPLOWO2_12_FULL_60_22]|nr:MAG: hypothetical protein A3J28_09135 [Acidobacteria bacterium RIFCSPLOWO2_12_FULL_60_22]
MRFAWIMVAAWVVSAGTLFGQQVSPLLAPDTIYYNGKIITVDRPFSIAEAFAVKGNQFVAVGKNAEVRALAGPRTQQVDLRGHAVIPGLMDNHNHQIWRARVMQRGMDMVTVPSLAEMLNRLRQAAAKAKPGEVIVGSGGWFPRNFPEKRGPTRKDLDEASPTNPVFQFQSGRNNANLNSAALKILGIDRNTKDWGSFPILKDDTGEPTGELSGGEQVLAADFKMLPQPTVDQQIEWLMQEQQGQHALGLTGIRELVLPVEHMRTYLEMWRQGKLTMRVSMGLMFGVQHVDGWAPQQMDQMLSPLPMMPGFGNDMLQFDATLAEFEVDTQRVGNMMRRPFLRPNNRRHIGEEIGRWPHSDFLTVLTDAQGNYYGVQRLPTDRFIEVVRKMNRYGWRPGFHISGDRGLDMNLEAYEAADREHSLKDKRWVVEHIQYSHPEQMARLAKLNILVSTQMQGINGPNPNFSKELNERVQPIREWLDHGLIVSSGSDWPAFNNNPFPYLQWYVTRITNAGEVLGAAQKISREEALRLATINNAYLMFREKDLGSIEAGKLADFLILSADFLTVPAEQIKDLSPLATYVGGRKVFAKPGGGF